MVRIPKSSSTFLLSWTLSALTQRSAAPPINARMPTVQGDAGPRADEEHGMRDPGFFAAGLPLRTGGHVVGRISTDYEV